MEPAENTILGPESLPTAFNTQAYLWDFYAQVDDPAMQMMVMLLPNIAERIKDCDSLLDFGAGPTIHVSTALRNRVKNIYLADYLPQNRQELLRWLVGQSSFDWTNVLKKIAAIEGTSWIHLKKIEQETRSKVRAIFHCDCHKSPSIAAPRHLQKNFDIVVTILCLEYCCQTEGEYKTAVKNVTEQVKPGGIFIMGGAMEETWCAFGGHKFACFYLTEETLLGTLRECNILVDSPDAIYFNSNGVFLICARKSSEVVKSTNSDE